MKSQKWKEIICELFLTWIILIYTSFLVKPCGKCDKSSNSTNRIYILQVVKMCSILIVKYFFSIYWLKWNKLLSNSKILFDEKFAKFYQTFFFPFLENNFLWCRNSNASNWSSNLLVWYLVLQTVYRICPHL